ncbi:hypothetical protein CRG98_039623 [Punica granatum]|uniref:Uncharacterized protein n=1 Tax=Punica granatum TaxID=22663 RepID=A0A2I0I8H4_PUNGR|nr:hypothetical protein CRG98_039623 [Punica granatum]
MGSRNELEQTSLSSMCPGASEAVVSPLCLRRSPLLALTISHSKVSKIHTISVIIRKASTYPITPCQKQVEKIAVGWRGMYNRQRWKWRWR